MKKKLVSLVLAVASLFSYASLAIAQDDTPKVMVDQREVYFADQNPVIVNDRTLVPARGVFEAMGAKVEWKEAERTVVVSNAGNTIYIHLTIDSDEMKIYTYKNVLEADESKVTLDVPAQIMNDRTMVPLRAISESLKADVTWSQEDYTVYINTKPAATTTPAPTATAAPDPDATVAPTATPGTGTPTDPSATATPEPTATQAPTDSKVTVSIRSDKESVAKDEEFDIYVDVKGLGLYPDYYLNALTATIFYDNSNFELMGVSMLDENGKEIEKTLGGVNAAFKNDSAKCIFMIIHPEDGIKKDGSVGKITFKSLSQEKGTFLLSNRITDRGQDTEVQFSNENLDTLKLNKSDVLTIDTTPLVINNK